MPYKDRQKQREYQREWARRKRAGIPTKGISPRKSLTEEERKERKRNNERKWRRNLRKRRDEIWGVECFFCYFNKYLVLHKKDGMSHPDNTGYLITAFKEPEKWVRLCRNCHTGVHFCMNIFGWSWETIASHIIVGVPATKPFGIPQIRLKIDI